jgi:hypothetical protein
MLEVHDRLAVIFPCCASFAEPVKLTGVPCSNEEPLDGAEIETVGGVFPDPVIVTVMDAEPGRPPGSVAVAVIVCVPTSRPDVENEPPKPIWPFRFEFHTSDEVTLPDWASVAEPVNVTDAPCANEEPFAGAEIVTTGGVLLPPGRTAFTSKIFPSFSLGLESLSIPRSTM